MVEALFGIGAEDDVADETLVRAALARGYVTPEQLEECRAEAARLGGTRDRPTLGRILVQRRALSLDRYIDLLEKSRSDATIPGARIGRYKLVREIAHGGMGVVFEAYDAELKRPVAVKVIREDRASAEIVQRLHREACIVAQLRHPNIVAVHDVGIARDPSGCPVHFIAMDYIDGGTLSGILANPAVSREDRIRMLEDVARAVAYTHSKGVFHRDLKPDNVLVDSDRRVVLTDFGLAHGEGFRSRLTQSRTLMGTPQYMAPEQVDGRTQEIDGRTDIYALGVMMYQLLTNQLPYPEQTPARLFDQINQGNPAPPSRIRASVPREFEVVCLEVYRHALVRFTGTSKPA